MFTKAFTRNSSLAALAACALAAACASGSLSNEELARARMRRAPTQPSRDVQPVTHAPTSSEGAQAFTWQKRTSAAGKAQLVVYGEGLESATAILVGDTELAAAGEDHGRRLVSAFPRRLADDAPVRVRVGGRLIELPERFSALKPDGLPTVESVFYTRERVRSPKRRGREVDAIRFQFTLSGYEQRDAPLTVFFGDHAVPHDQIEDHPDRMSGWVYGVRSLSNGCAVTIDFGQGLRVLATGSFAIPR